MTFEEEIPIAFVGATCGHPGADDAGRYIFCKLHKYIWHKCGKFYPDIFSQTLTNVVIWGMIYCGKT